MKPPKQLFLQVTDDDGEPLEWQDWTHSEKRVFDTDIRYVKAPPEPLNESEEE